MISEKYLRNICCEFINESGSEFDVLERIEMIRMALISTSESSNRLSQIRPRIKRMLRNLEEGVINHDTFDSNMNKIQNAVNQILMRLNSDEVAVLFDLDKEGGYDLVYQIANIDNEPIYKFKGKLYLGKPTGRGVAIYPNGDFFEGNFRKGNRSGEGTLYNKEKKILREGFWEKDRYVDKHLIKYYNDISVAANSLSDTNELEETNYELIKSPNIAGKNLIAFPVQGDSMEPNFKEGDVVVCSKINDILLIQNNKIHVIFHNDTLVIKRVQKIELENIRKFSLISDNYLYHHPYEIEPNEQTIFYKIISQLKSFK